VASGPTQQLLRGRSVAAIAWLRARGRALGASLDASPALRVPVGLLFVVATPALVAFVRTDIAAAEMAARLAGSFVLLAWLGRGLRLACERALGAARFGVWRDPVWDGLVGWLFAMAMLLLGSLVWKRGFASAEPIGLALPIVWLALAAVLTLPRRFRAAASPTRREFARLGGFLSAFAWLAGGHLGVRRPYSSDPEQHVAWLTQLELFGFVPDAYWQTDAPITYPMGFASLAHSLSAVAGATAAEWIALIPPFASALLVYLAVAAARELIGRREPRRGDAWLFALVFVALASALESAQFSGWNVYEGTGRLAAGPLHAVPLMALFAAASGAVRLQTPGASRAGARAGLWAFACAATTALVILLNPSHLLLHTVLWAVAIGAALLASGWGVHGLRGVAIGVVAGCVVGVALLAADGVSARRVLGIGEVDPALARVEAEFDTGFGGQTCWSPRCILSAGLRLGSLASFATPARVVVEGPVRVFVQPEYDRFRIPWVGGPRSFPDLTGSGVAPLHGLARWTALPLPFWFAWVLWRSRERRHSGWTYALAALLLAASLDAAARAALRAWVHPDDAALRLLPDYATRAAAVAFAQSFWPLAVAGLVFGTRSVRGRAVAAAVLAIVFLTAQSELGTRRAELERWRRGPDSRDIADLRALEAVHVPPGEHYLVSSHVTESNRERWIVPIDLSSSLYARAARPALFLYHLSSGARVTAADLEQTCRSVAPGRPSPLMAAYRARWVALILREGRAPRVALGARRFCKRPFDVLFPDAELAGVRGRVALFRLW